MLSVSARLHSASRLAVRSLLFHTRKFASTTPVTSETVNYTLPEYSFIPYECEPPPSEIEVTKEDALDMYKKMVVIRRMELAADGLYKSKLIKGFCHLCTGQEAVSVGMEAAITPEDHIITAYRCHGYTHMRGQSVYAISAELMSRATGVSKGKGGSMHMFAKNFYGGNGIVGAQVPVGAGIAFTQNYLKTGKATFVLYGDGAANQGQVFEAFNMSKLWNLPTIYVCENNLYGMGTSSKRSSANSEYYTRGQYIPGLKVNGMDVLAIRHSCKWAKDWVASGKGPLVMEMVTYRYGGHSMSDPGTTYRTREEIQLMRSTKDPITGLKQRILDFGFADEAEISKIDKKARSFVDGEVRKAQEDPLPDPSELFTDIYVKGTEPPYCRGREREELAFLK